MTVPRRSKDRTSNSMTESDKAIGGRAYYGQAVGIALFDGRHYPMIPGDVGNASTYDFSVRLKVVRGLFDCPSPL